MKKIFFMLIIVILLVSSCSRPIEKINNINGKVVENKEPSDNVNTNENTNVDSPNEVVKIEDEVIEEDIDAEDVELDNIGDLFEDF